MEEEPLIIFYLELSKKSKYNKYPLCLDVKSLKGRRKIRTLKCLTENEFEKQKEQINSDCRSVHENLLYSEIMQVKYAISQLKRNQKHYVLADIIDVYKENRKCFSLEFYIKNIIKEMRADGRKNEAYFCNSLLTKIKSFSSFDISLNIGMLNESWFTRFQYFLEENGVPANVAKLDLDYLRKIYVKACRENKFKILYPFGGLHCTTVSEIRGVFTSVTLKKMLEANYEDTKKCLARKAFLFMYYAPDISLLDMIQLRTDDIYPDKIWYRSNVNNDLCCVPLSEEIRLLLDCCKEESDAIFPSFRSEYRAKSEQVYMNLCWYNKQMKNLAKLLAIEIKWSILRLQF